jgi:hypothetical protein
LIPPECLDFSVTWPMREGELNTVDYKSAEHLALDLSLCWQTAIEKELDIKFEELRNMNVLLIVSDIHSRSDILLMIEILVNRLKFASFSLLPVLSFFFIPNNFNM